MYAVHMVSYLVVRMWMWLGLILVTKISCCKLSLMQGL